MLPIGVSREEEEEKKKRKECVTAVTDWENLQFRPGSNSECETRCASTCQRTAYVANSDFGYTCNTTLSSTN